MTQPERARAGVWDSVFSLVFGNRGRAPRAQAAPRSTPSVAAAPAPPAPQPQPASAPAPAEAPVNVEAQTPPAPGDAPTNLEATQPAPSDTHHAPPEATPPAPEPSTEPAPPPSSDARAPPDVEVAPPVTQPAAGGLTPFAAKLVEVAEAEFAAFRQGEVVESDDVGVELVAKYWQAVADLQPNLSDADRAQIRRRNGRDGVAWSAAFISYVMHKAGAGDRFYYCQGHSGYVKAALKAKDDPDGPFRAVKFDDCEPEIGDLVANLRPQSADWKRRYGADATVTFDNAADYADFSSHCDLVIGKEPGALIVIGGNVSNEESGGDGVTVNKKRLSLENGRIKQRGGSYPFFAVLRNCCTDPHPN